MLFQRQANGLVIGRYFFRQRHCRQGRIRLGRQFARIRLGRAQASRALLVSERAIGTDQSRKFVWVVGADNKAEYREVQLGASTQGLRVVTSGLASGERIVVNGLQRVRPGALLAPQLVEMNARATAAGKPAQS